ncbi:MAG: hypothetical protein JSW11_09965 [Candidatus Heimdallarchaeota archaeon]|nr:MAG: hypothetical protein JSW11_09965 [Candidatus Heimdallarchaeota archaeon]
MVSFDELETFLAFFVFSSQGKPLINKDFRNLKDKKAFPPPRIQSLLSSAYEISQGLDEESISHGDIFHIDFSSMRIAGIVRSEGMFSLIASASASILDIEFKLRTLMSLFIGNFEEKLSKKTVRLSVVEKEEFEEFIKTVMAGESRYMSSPQKREVEDCLHAWVISDDAIRGACISSFTGAVIVNEMDAEILPAAVRAIRGAFAAHLEKPKFFLAVSGIANLFVYILGEGLLLLVDSNPDVPSSATIERVEGKVAELRNLIL